MMDLLCQMFYTMHCLRKKCNSMYSTYEFSSFFISTQIFMLIGDIVLLLHLAGIAIPIPAEFIRLLDYNSLFLISMILLYIVLAGILFYLLFGRNRKLIRMLLHARRKYGRKCKWRMLWLVFSPFLLMCLLFFVVCAKNNGYF